MPTTIQVASANIEWMNNWFMAGSGPARWKPEAKTAAALAAQMLKDIGADIIAVEEAPSRKEEIQLFIEDFLTANGKPLYSYILGDSGGAQKLAVLFRPTLQVSEASEADFASLLAPWQCDVEGTMQLAPYEFTRAPLLVDVTLGTDVLRLIAMHTKSNFVQNGKQLWTQDRQKYVVAALKSRRRIAAEAMRLRSYLDALVGADLSRRVIVLGDLNDGPGMDYFEEKYLAHNVTDILIGSAFEPEFLFTHAQHDFKASERYSVVFDDFVDDVKEKRLLLDHILLSPGLLVDSGPRMVRGSGRVHHQEWQQNVVNQGAAREERPSDHRPVSVHLEY